MTSIPKGAQLLFFPMMEATIAAGYRDPSYTRHYGYVHLGMDLDERGSSGFDVVAGASGTVLGVEMNHNSIGGVVVVRYPRVYNPATKEVRDLIARHYHLAELTVKQGEQVAPYQRLGRVLGDHPWWNHVHIELDSDVDYPFHTPQVSEGASRLLIRNPSSDRSILDPAQVLVVGRRQKAQVHPRAVYVTAKDRPRWREEDFAQEAARVCPTCGRAL